MASITKRGNSWRVRVGYLTQDGTRDFETATFKKKKEAIAWASDLEGLLQTGYIPHSKDYTLADYYDEWYATYKEPVIRNGTKRNYVSTGKLIRKYFGAMPIADVTRMEYQKFLNTIGETRAKQTCHAISITIRAVVKSALADGAINRDFTVNTVASGRPSKPASEKYLELHDANKLTAKVIEILNSPEPDFRAMSILIAIKTGARLAEVSGLTWKDVDFHEHTIDINKTFTRDLSAPFGPTKNRQSTRVIDVDNQLIEQLKKYRPRQQLMFWQALRQNELNLICSSPTYSASWGNSIEDYLRSILKDVEITKKITYHGLRHTHASFLLGRGVSIPYVSQRLGHKNPNVTMRVYAHLLQADQHVEAAKAVNALAQLG